MELITNQSSSDTMVHDFRPSTFSSEWNGLSWKVAYDHKTIKMTGTGSGLLVGHYVMVNSDEGITVAHKIEEIEYQGIQFTAVLCANECLAASFE